MPAGKLSDEELSRYGTEGFLVVPGLLSPREADDWKSVV